VEYNADAEYHINLKRETENVKTQAKRKGGAAALRAQSAAVATPGEGTEPPTPRSKGDPLPPVAAEDEKPSPASSTSSGSEPPLAQRVKINGTAHTQPSPVPPEPPAPMPVNNVPVPTVPSAPGPPAKVSWVSLSQLSKRCTLANTYRKPPLSPWLSDAMREMHAKWPDDRFDTILRKVSTSATAEWRIKCVDCPGKVCWYAT
jgi:SWI/SNF-related matrix-associated actin-dependent regulator of chromatin subfamily B member 1